MVCSRNNVRTEGGRCSGVFITNSYFELEYSNRSGGDGEPPLSGEEEVYGMVYVGIMDVP
jgi:hypothetical protein